MTRAATPPEPGIATDEELHEAADQLRDALGALYSRGDVVAVNPERFNPLHYATDEWSEVIDVRLDGDERVNKETVINQVMKSDAPVQLRDLERERPNRLTFYPTNQER